MKIINKDNIHLFDKAELPDNFDCDDKKLAKLYKGNHTIYRKGNKVFIKASATLTKDATEKHMVLNLVMYESGIKNAPSAGFSVGISSEHETYDTALINNLYRYMRFVIKGKFSMTTEGSVELFRKTNLANFSFDREHLYFLWGAGVVIDCTDGYYTRVDALIEIGAQYFNIELKLTYADNEDGINPLAKITGKYCADGWAISETDMANHVLALIKQQLEKDGGFVENIIKAPDNKKAVGKIRMPKIKRVGQYYVDRKGNKWNVKRYSFAEAQKNARRMRRSYGNINCSELTDSHRNINCSFLRNSHRNKSSKYLLNSQYCDSCICLKNGVYCKYIEKGANLNSVKDSYLCFDCSHSTNLFGCFRCSYSAHLVFREDLEGTVRVDRGV